MAMTKQRIMALKIPLSELCYLSMLLFGGISRSLRKVVSTLLHYYSTIKTYLALWRQGISTVSTITIVRLKHVDRGPTFTDPITFLHYHSTIETIEAVVIGGAMLGFLHYHSTT